MNYLFTTWEGGGCVTPALDVVRQLMARGHQVRVLSDACNQREAEASGARFIPWQRAPSRPDRTPETQVFRDWAAPTPQAGLMEVVRDIWCAPALAYAQDLLAELRREPADLVVTSECLFGVMAACESSGQRCVIFAPTISLSALPGVPPLGPGLAPARNDEERAQHAAIAAGITGMFDSGLPLLNEARAALNLPPLVHLMDQFRAAEFEFQGTARAFDFATDPLPPRVRYVGPQISDPHWVRKWVSPWPDTDGRPLILVSFSTTFQNHAGVLQRIIQALATTPTRVLVTLGGAIRADELQPAANCVLVESAPHSEVLPAASLVIHHGGHGTQGFGEVTGAGQGRGGAELQRSQEENVLTARTGHVEVLCGGINLIASAQVGADLRWSMRIRDVHTGDDEVVRIIKTGKVKTVF